MTCEHCGKDMLERTEQLNGAEVPFPICYECEEKLHKKIDEYPKKHGKRK